MKLTRTLNMAIALLVAVSALIVTENVCKAGVRPLVIHFGELVDNESGSADCLACHDGTIAKGVEFQNWSHQSSSNPLSSHPVEVTYPSEWSGKSFAPSSEIGKSGIRLIDGKVSCISCHDLRLQKRDYLLPVTMNHSGLCFACHQI